MNGQVLSFGSALSFLALACSDPGASPKTATTISSAASPLEASATAAAAGASTALPSSPELLAKIATQFKPPCKLRKACGDLLGIDCNSASDGPYYYVKADTLAVVSTCGGACMGGCTNCPPKEWICK